MSKCDRCKHQDKEWYEEPCDGCCGAHSGFEPKEGAHIVMVPIKVLPLTEFERKLRELATLSNEELAKYCEDCKYFVRDGYICTKFAQDSDTDLEPVECEYCRYSRYANGSLHCKRLSCKVESYESCSCCEKADDYELRAQVRGLMEIVNHTRNNCKENYHDND